MEQVIYAIRYVAIVLANPIRNKASQNVQWNTKDLPTLIMDF